MYYTMFSGCVEGRKDGRGWEWEQDRDKPGPYWFIGHCLALPDLWVWARCWLQVKMKLICAIFKGWDI